jgi:hypothetical protein
MYGATVKKDVIALIQNVITMMDVGHCRKYI